MKYGSAYLAERSVVQRVDDAEEQVRVGSTISGEACRPIPADEEQGGPEDVPWDLHEQLRSDQSGPLVHATVLFADLEDAPHLEEGHLELFNERRSKEGGDVDRLGHGNVSYERLAARLHELLTKSLFCVPCIVLCDFQYVKPMTRAQKTLTAIFAMR